MELEIHASQRDRQLPMIVNLRGDEDHAEDFSIDADQAMEILGIKRSRLTQISGRELRVGRVRRDRYIRPYYRESDLRDYQEWTRATATHQSSSKAIEQAIDSLDDRFNDLFVVLHERLEQYQVREQSFVRERFDSLKAGFDRQFQGLTAALNHLAQSGDQGLQQGALLLKTQRKIGDEQLKSGSLLIEVEQRFEMFHQDLREALVGFKLVRRELEELRAQLAAEMARERQEQATVLQNLELTITKSQSQVLDRLADLAQAMPRAEAVAPPPRKPRQHYKKGNRGRSYLARP